MRPYRALALAAVTAIAVGAALPASAETCGERNHNRKVAGTVIGGLGGALLGNAISKGGGGAVVGGLGGAVIGNHVARVKCDNHTAYRSSGSYRTRTRYVAAPQPAAPRAVRYVYYDQYGAPVSSGPAPTPAPVSAYGAPVSSYGAPVYTQVGYDAACRTENRAFYDERGVLVYRPMQVCAR